MSEPFDTPVTDSSALRSGALPFFTVSLIRLTVMMLVTFGLYGLYWYYKNWSRYKAYSAKPIWPLVRTFLALIFVPSLFSNVNAVLEEKGQRGMPFWQALATGMILFALAPSVAVIAKSIAVTSGGGVAAGFGFSAFEVSVIATLGQLSIMLWVQLFINRANRNAEVR